LGSIDISAAARSVLSVGKLADSKDENVRVMAHTKSNLAPLGKSMEFELNSTDGFKWLGECKTTADDVLNGKTQKKRESQVDRAKRIIESFLFNGYKVAANDIIEAAASEGVSPRTLNRAKLELGVKSERIDGYWYWYLPVEVIISEVKEDCQEYQDSVMIMLTTLQDGDAI
jgi:hypothetical protein